MITALLTAAGIGSRMNQEIPKQFMHVDNKPLIIYTLEAFQNHSNIDNIIVVTLPSWIEVLRVYARQYGITKLRWIVPGGDTGQESIRNGLAKLKEEGLNDDDIVMIHDGNRCLVSADLISNSIAVFHSKGSAVAAIPCTEAVFKSNDNGESSIVTIPRKELFRTQTPHTYTLSKLLWAHDQAEKKGIMATAASCVLMQKLGEKVYFSMGSEINLKITTVDDLKIFEAILHSEAK